MVTRAHGITDVCVCFSVGPSIEPADAIISVRKGVDIVDFDAAVRPVVRAVAELCVYCSLKERRPQMLST